MPAVIRQHLRISTYFGNETLLLWSIRRDKRGTYRAVNICCLHSRQCYSMPATFRKLRQQGSPILLGNVPFPMAAMHESAATSHARVEWERAVVLAVARGIEPDADKVVTWFNGDLIDELGGKTARQLVEEGATAKLLDMLVTIRNGYRDR